MFTMSPISNSGTNLSHHRPIARVFRRGAMWISMYACINIQACKTTGGLGACVPKKFLEIKCSLRLLLRLFLNSKASDWPSMYAFAKPAYFHHSSVNSLRMCSALVLHKQLQPWTAVRLVDNTQMVGHLKCLSSVNQY